MTQFIAPVPADQPTFAAFDRCEDIATLEADIAIIGAPFGMPYHQPRSRLMLRTPSVLPPNGMDASLRTTISTSVDRFSMARHYGWSIAGISLALPKQVRRIMLAPKQLSAQFVLVVRCRSCSVAMIRFRFRSCARWMISAISK